MWSPSFLPVFMRTCINSILCFLEWNDSIQRLLSLRTDNSNFLRIASWLSIRFQYIFTNVGLLCLQTQLKSFSGQLASGQIMTLEQCCANNIEKKTLAGLCLTKMVIYNINLFMKNFMQKLAPFLLLDFLSQNCLTFFIFDSLRACYSAMIILVIFKHKIYFAF